MTQLSLILHQPHANGLIETGAIASVRLLADSKGKTVKSGWSCEKPVSILGDLYAGIKAEIFNLPIGGIYGIKITLPRGSDIYQEFAVSDGESHAETISLEASPHEYLSWQHYAGVVRANSYQRMTVGIPSVTKSARLVELRKQSQTRIDALYSGVKDIPTIFVAEIPKSENAWKQVGEAIFSHERSWVTATPFSNYTPTSDEEYATWFLGSPSPSDAMELIRQLTHPIRSPWALLSFKYPRWMAFNSAGRIDLVSVPWVWWGAIPKENNEEIRVIYNRIRAGTANHSEPGRLTLNVLDQRWFGLLEFLASGRLSRTRVMLDQVLKGEHSEDLFDTQLALYGKVKSPLVATAGAIVLIALAESTETQIWDPWLENLSRWFPGIPDGAILLGCRRIDQARNSDDIRVAYKLLDEGIKRGIPFFAATILMLSLRLSQIAEVEPEADRLSRLIAPISTRIDPDQVFTVIRL